MSEVRERQAHDPAFGVRGAGKRKQIIRERFALRGRKLRLHSSFLRLPLADEGSRLFALLRFVELRQPHEKRINAQQLRYGP